MIACEGEVVNKFNPLTGFIIQKGFTTKLKLCGAKGKVLQPASGDLKTGTLLIACSSEKLFLAFVSVRPSAFC